MNLEDDYSNSNLTQAKAIEGGRKTVATLLATGGDGIVDRMERHTMMFVQKKIN